MNRSLLIAVGILAVAVIGGAVYLFRGNTGPERQFVGVDGATDPQQSTPSTTALDAATNASTPRGMRQQDFPPVRINMLNWRP